MWLTLIFKQLQFLCKFWSLSILLFGTHRWLFTTFQNVEENSFPKVILKMCTNPRQSITLKKWLRFVFFAFCLRLAVITVNSMNLSKHQVTRNSQREIYVGTWGRQVAWGQQPKLLRTALPLTQVTLVSLEQVIYWQTHPLGPCRLCQNLRLMGSK